MIDKLPNGLRWLLFIPLAVLLSWIFYLVFFFAQYLFISPDSFYAKYALPILTSAMSSVIFMMVAVEVIPKYKAEISTLVIIAMAGISIIGCVLYYQKNENMNLYKSIGSLIGFLLGYIGTLDAARKEQSVFDKQ